MPIGEVSEFNTAADTPPAVTNAATAIASATTAVNGKRWPDGAPADIGTAKNIRAAFGKKQYSGAPKPVSARMRAPTPLSSGVLAGTNTGAAKLAE